MDKDQKGNIGGPPPRVENQIQTAIEAGRRLTQEARKSPLDNGVPYIILRNADGSDRIEYLRERFERPARKAGTVKLNDEHSLIEYWRRHKVDGYSSLYGCMSPAQFVAILNDHEANGEDACYQDHRAIYQPKHSKEWLEWSNRSGQKFDSGVHFAEWLEDHIPDIVTPEGAAMLEIALNFKVTANAAYSAATRMTDGNTQFSYNNTVEGSSRVGQGFVRIPETFVISIPVFEGINAPKYTVDARFRYRLNGSSLSIWFDLVRPHKVVERAFEDILGRIEESTSIKVLFGSPA